MPKKKHGITEKTFRKRNRQFVPSSSFFFSCSTHIALSFILLKQMAMAVTERILSFTAFNRKDRFSYISRLGD
jgi:hypothetical protein